MDLLEMGREGQPLSVQPQGEGLQNLPGAHTPPWPLGKMHCVGPVCGVSVCRLGTTCSGLSSEVPTHTCPACGWQPPAWLALNLHLGAGGGAFGTSCL